MLRERGGCVAFDVPLPMVRLFQDLDGVDVALKDGDTLPTFDCHIPLRVVRKNKDKGLLAKS